LGIDDEGIAPLRARAGIQGDAPEIRLGALGKTQRARPVVVPAQPEPVNGIVIDEWVEVIDPGVLWTWLVLRDERGGEGEE